MLTPLVMALIAAAMWGLTIWALSVSDTGCWLWVALLVTFMVNLVMDGWIVLAEHAPALRAKVALWTALVACMVVCVLIVFVMLCGQNLLRAVAVIQCLNEIAFATTVALRVER